MYRTISLVLFLVLAIVGSSAAGQATKYKAPRTESGHPDLQGVWNFSSGVPLQRPPAFADKKVATREEYEKHRAALQNAFSTILKIAPVEAIGVDLLDNTPLVEDLRTSLISYPENGRLPVMVEGVRRLPGPEDAVALLAETKGGPPPAVLQALIAAFTGGKKDSYTDFMPSERCLLAATVPLTPQLDGNYLQIIQSRDHIVLLMDFDRRIISLDRQGPLADTHRSWSGTSTGHWEGDTLVVETRNFNTRMPSFAGAGNSFDKVVVERFTRTEGDRIEYAATVTDPKTFKDRIELSFPMALVEAQMYEGACHEGNYSLRNSLSAARKNDEAKKLP